MTTKKDLFTYRKTTPRQALDFFDELKPASCEFMLGRWKGFEIITGHPMEGLLELSGWYGKYFSNTETVHPLLIYANHGKALYSLNPRWVPLKMQFPKTKLIGILMTLLKPFLQTRKSTARLRIVKYRNKATATMCYDEKAIFDHFAIIDDNTVLGIMDLKGESQPYVFVLERDDQSVFKHLF